LPLSLIDTRTSRILFTALLFALGLGLVYAARRTLIWFLFAIFFAYLMAPAVSRLERVLHSRGRAIAVIYILLTALVVVFFVAHYMFASLTAHATALLPVFLAAGMAMSDVPARPLALLLCYAIGLMGVLTPYATGPAPIYSGSGYISRPAFWTLGGTFGALFLLGLLALGVPWLLSGIP